MSVRRLMVVARDEFTMNLRRPLVWIMLILITLLVWGLSEGGVQIVIASGDASVGGKKAFLTSEFAVSQIVAVLSYTLYLFTVSAAAGLSVVRDSDAGVLELLNATPLTPGEYAWGKFTGTVGAFLGVLVLQVLLMMVFLQWIPNANMLETRGPFVVMNYLRPALLFAFPMILFTGGVSFWIGHAHAEADPGLCAAGGADDAERLLPVDVDADVAERVVESVSPGHRPGGRALVA